MIAKVSILGSTGSIGRQAIEVIKDLKGIQVCGLSANTSIDLLEAQVRELSPEKVAVMDEQKALTLRQRLSDTGIHVVAGQDGVSEVATLPGAEMVVSAMVGNVGLRPTLEAINAGKDIALANKETLVTAGALVIQAAKDKKCRLYPIDSEHSAIFQCLQGNEPSRVRRLYLTASGGPFRGRKDLGDVTLEQALRHPNWSMGKKITIDSATMMNKGLEVIEAGWLFAMPPEKIQVLVHPQSVIHSMVEYEDGAVLAQLGEPDMRLPIQYALMYPDRPANTYPRLNFLQKSTLTFEEPDMHSFPCLRLAYDAMAVGGTMPAVLNGANEAAVEMFIDGKIKFTDIPLLIEKAMSSYTVRIGQSYKIGDVYAADQWGRDKVRLAMGGI